MKPCCSGNQRPRSDSSSQCCSYSQRPRPDSSSRVFVFCRLTCRLRSFRRAAITTNDKDQNTSVVAVLQLQPATTFSFQFVRLGFAVLQLPRATTISLIHTPSFADHANSHDRIPVRASSFRHAAIATTTTKTTTKTHAALRTEGRA